MILSHNTHPYIYLIRLKKEHQLSYLKQNAQKVQLQWYVSTKHINKPKTIPILKHINVNAKQKGEVLIEHHMPGADWTLHTTITRI